MTERAHTWTDPTKRGSGRNMSTDQLFSLVGDDDEIMAKVKLLVNMILHNAVQVMLTGTVDERTAMSKAMLPAIVRMIATNEEGGLAQLRADMMETLDRMMPDGPGNVEPPVPVAGPMIPDNPFAGGG